MHVQRVVSICPSDRGSHVDRVALRVGSPRLNDNCAVAVLLCLETTCLERLENGDLEK